MLYLKLCKYDLKPLYDILHGNACLVSPCELTPEGRKAIRITEQAIQSQSSNFMDYNQPLIYIICKTVLLPTAVFWQTAPLMWAHLPATSKCVLGPYYQAVSDLIVIGRKQGKCFFERT